MCRVDGGGASATSMGELRPRRPLNEPASFIMTGAQASARVRHRAHKAG